MVMSRHKCYHCEPVTGMTGLPADLDSIESTLSERGDEIFFASGYSAREIAQRRATETNAKVYVNNVSRKIKRPDLSVPVSYAVAASPVYTLKSPDEFHATVHRAYWPPLSR